MSSFSFYDLPKRKGFLSGTNNSWTLPGISRVYSTSDVAEVIIESSWETFRQTNFQDTSSIPHVPSQWSFNGMSEEMTGSVYGPLDSVRTATLFADRIRRGQWMINGSGKELVMVLERWEASVVALGSLMGMSTGNGLKSDLLYTHPINPSKKSSLGLSVLAMQRLGQLTVADQLIYEAANDRLQELMGCLHVPLDCFIVKKSNLLQLHDDSGDVSKLLEEHLNAVAEAKMHCAAGGNTKLETTFCEALELTDREWSIRMNSPLPKPAETTTQVFTVYSSIQYISDK